MRGEWRSIAQPYGVSVVGGTVSVVMTAADGSLRSLPASIGAQAAYGALPLPYAHFGLGRTTSYVQSLVLGVALSQVRVSVRCTRRNAELIPCFLYRACCA